MMKAYECEKLSKLLLDLMCAQDSVTHANEKGYDRAATDELIVKRSAVKAQILGYVESITS